MICHFEEYLSSAECLLANIVFFASYRYLICIFNFKNQIVTNICIFVIPFLSVFFLILVFLISDLLKAFIIKIYSKNAAFYPDIGKDLGLLNQNFGWW